MSILHRKPTFVFDEFSRLMNAWEDEKAHDKVTVSHWQPAVDIKETAEAFVLFADLPGISPSDIEIAMEDNILTLRGHRHENKEEKQENYSRSERIYGEFYRRFTLPETADSEKIAAKSKHGVLQLTIPKKERARPQRINVEVVED